MKETIHKGMLFNEDGSLKTFNKNGKEKQIHISKEIKKAEITKKHKVIFDEYKEFLGNATDEQKLGIVHDAKHIICIAGAGCGKTKVLTERAKYLINSKKTKPEHVLAITFTKKAKTNMLTKLEDYHGVKVETFNSFCEKILLKNDKLIYNQPTRVIKYGEKIQLVVRALTHLGVSMEDACEDYFEDWQKRLKDPMKLRKQFVDDCFFIRDYFISNNKKMTPLFYKIIDKKHQDSAKLIHDICIYINEFMEENGLRDYADQIVDTIKFFENNPKLIPHFDHILIDEYQDINSVQLKLVKMLNPDNVFAVGDPRQAIYGWRGSDISYITNFSNDFNDAEKVYLTINHRSTNTIVEFANKCIENMKLENLKSFNKGDNDIYLCKFINEDEEYQYIVDTILESKISRDEIFILARKNAQLFKMEEFLKANNIKFITRRDEERVEIEPKHDEVTLSTVHSIKGLEAEMVFVINASNNNFPNFVSDHPILEIIKIDSYDKEDEEKRLFYVAITRAKKTLHISYSKDKHTEYLSYSMKDMMKKKGVY